MAKTASTRVIALDEALIWNADKRFLPVHLRGSDNTRRIEHYKKALRTALDTKLSTSQREQIYLFYYKGLTKTEIGRRQGVGSSAVCKSLKAAEGALRDYIELYMGIYDQLLLENLDDDGEYDVIQGG